MRHDQTRYPGVQPFTDEPISRRLFFGRELESRRLADKILANRLVVIYAKSGLGKTSLLNAGVAQLLRDADHLPLIVRVNDIQSGAFASVVNGIRAAGEQQHIEVVSGNTSSLWYYFKTVEFWRGDLLLTPALILDQFEELFTLQPPDSCDAFLADLGYLVRGVPPPTANAASDLSDKPPAVSIALSLREDFLGFLEEAADRIPQILDERFRLLPLSREAAAAATQNPARVEDPCLSTSPFLIDPESVHSILDYLSRQALVSPTRTSSAIEPFQLQLICQRIESIVAERQQKASSKVVVSLHDLGGEAGLPNVIKDYYERTLRQLPRKRQQHLVRRLCEEYLISPEGRRLSIEEHEIQQQLGVRPETLNALVASRLLRSEKRADSNYYELSHDALVAPVIYARRTKAVIVGFLYLTLGTLLCISSFFMLFFVFAQVFDLVLVIFPELLNEFIADVPNEEFRRILEEQFKGKMRYITLARSIILIFVFVIFFVAIFYVGKLVVSRGRTMIRRYRRRPGRSRTGTMVETSGSS